MFKLFGLRIAGITRKRASLSLYYGAAPIVVDHTKVAADQTDFPMLISGTFPTLKTVANGGSVQNASGYDIIVSSTNAPNGSGKMSFQVESYNAATGAINLWVKVPTLSSSVDTTLYLLYGNAAISVSQENITDVWSNNFITVQHLNGNSTDSTSNGFSGTDTAIAYAPAIIAEGAGFNGSTSQIDLGDSPGLDGGTAVTVSAWVNGTSWAQAYNAVEDREYNGASANGRTLQVKSTGKLAVYGVTTTGSFNLNYDGTGINTLATGTWYYLSYTMDTAASVLNGYVNGVLDGTATAGGTGSFAGAGAEGAHELFGQSIYTPRTFDGALDEIRVASVVRAADWLLTEFNNQNSPSTFCSISFGYAFELEDGSGVILLENGDRLLLE